MEPKTMSLHSERNPLAPLRCRRAKRPLRGLLLGAAASVALSTGLTLAPLSLARAEAPVTQGMVAVGPASFADMVDRVKGAVVSVKVVTLDKAEAETGEGGPGLPPGMPPLSPDDPLYRFFKRFGGPNGPHGEAPRPHKGQAQGSGFIISADGYLVTNNHVVENATDVSVTLDGGKTVTAKVIGLDKKTDLALLKISESGTYPYVQFSSDTPRVGDWVIAVGNPFGLGGTVTAGIVSARGRDIGSGPYDDYLQIDAPVNRGNSGGPTFNNKGEVVGVNTAIFSPSGGSVGIGFAIPSEVAKDVVGALKDKGAVTRGYIGVQIQPVTQDIADSLGLKSTKGALVAQTQPNTPAGKAGIATGDVITGVNGEKIDGPRELSRKIAGLGPNATAELSYIHNGSEKNASVKLGQLPNEKEAKLNVPPTRVGKTELAKFGMSLAPAADVPNAGNEGAAITDLDPEGVAAQKGLRAGDVILDAGGKPVTSPEDIVNALDNARKDGRNAVLLRVKTGDNTHFLALPANPS
jgi:serine protease Do